jgi:hypothetical protein
MSVVKKIKENEHKEKEKGIKKRKIFLSHAVLCYP